MDKLFLKLHIKVSANAKKQGFCGLIVVDDKTYLKLAINAPAVDGKANKAIIKFLSDYFDIAKGDVEITSGLTNKYKTVTITANNTNIETKIEMLLQS